MTDDDIARLQHVARLMSDASPEFRDAVSGTALILSEPISKKKRERLVEQFTDRLRVGLSRHVPGLQLSAEGVDEIIGALIIGAAEMALLFPTEGGRA